MEDLNLLRCNSRKSRYVHLDAFSLAEPTKSSQSLSPLGFFKKARAARRKDKENLNRFTRLSQVSIEVSNFFFLKRATALSPNPVPQKTNDSRRPCLPDYTQVTAVFPAFDAYQSRPGHSERNSA
jgi:hypothetical protein